MVADNQFPENTKAQKYNCKKGFEEAQNEINDLTALLEQARSRQRKFKTQYTELKNKLADHHPTSPPPQIRSASCSTISSQNVPRGLLGIGSGLLRGPTPARQTRGLMRRTETPGRGRETTTGLDFGMMEGGVQYESQHEPQSESGDESPGPITRNQRREREGTTFSVVVSTGAANEPYDLDTDPLPPRRRRRRGNTDSSDISDFLPDDEDFEPPRRGGFNASLEDTSVTEDEEVDEDFPAPTRPLIARRGRPPNSSNRRPTDKPLLGIRKRRIYIHSPAEDTPGIDAASSTEATPDPEGTTSTPAPRKRRKKGRFNMKTQFMPINESTMMPWTRPATQQLRLARSPSPLPQIKRETSPNGSDIVLIKSERRGSASPPPLNTASPAANNNDDDFVVIPGPPPASPPTQWNEDIMNSEEYGRKPYSHELLHTKEPFIFPDNTPPILPTPYTRCFLSRYIGGCEQLTFCNVTIQKQNENNHRIPIYFAKHQDWDAYLPKKPGDHGVAFLCEWSKASLQLDTQCSYPVFVYRKANHWEYCGEYVMFKRNCPPEEWNASPVHMRNTWTTQFAKRKTYKECIVREGYAENTEAITKELVAGLISGGTMKMYTHIYECVGYNWELARWLDERWAIHTRTEGGIKVEDDMEEEVFENM